MAIPIRFNGTGEADDINGWAAATRYGRGGDDDVQGEAGNDMLYGDDGNDTLVDDYNGSFSVPTTTRCSAAPATMS